MLRTNPTVSASSLTTIAWPMSGLVCHPRPELREL